MTRIEPGAPMPTLRIRSVSGEELDFGLAGSWEMVVVYRGKHCPLCCSYLSALNRLVAQLLTLTRRRWSISTSIVFESGFPRSGGGGQLKEIPPRCASQIAGWRLRRARTQRINAIGTF